MKGADLERIGLAGRINLIALLRGASRAARRSRSAPCHELNATICDNSNLSDKYVLCYRVDAEPAHAGVNVA